MLRELRQFFDDRGFLEVQPPCLSRDCIVDAFIDPIEVATSQLQVGLVHPPQYYLQTSPELAMKRMLAAGAPSIYSLGPVFRAGEVGANHNPEFTMLEWYQVNADLNDGIQLLGELATRMLQRDTYDVITYRELFLDCLGLDPIEADIGELHGHVRKVDASLAASIGDDRDALLDVLLSQCVQPTLGIDRPVIVKNYPLSQAALARPAEDDATCAARYELFAGGLELANGYDELRDANVLSERFRQTDRRRVAAGRKALTRENPWREREISAGLPPCTGVALGVDRLLMVVLGKRSIGDVIPLTIDLA
jgi:lysyl-tRNA synthetase class 2